MQPEDQASQQESAGEDQDLEEAQPLLQGKDVIAEHLAGKKRKFSPYHTFFEQPVTDDLNPSIQDAMTYKLPWLKAWGVFMVVKDTVWDNDSLWLIMRRLLMLCITFAVLAYWAVPDPTLIDVSVFSEMNTVLSAFVTLMLSFFLASAVSRWISCVDGFFMMFNSIKNYSMQLHALGVEEAKILLAMRYCVLSATFLVHELRCMRLDADKAKVATDLLWDYLLSGESHYSQVHQIEKDVLDHVDDKAAQMWIWVASHLGRMAKDGDVPPMASPTYGRLMNLVQAAQDGQRETRLSIIVQMPVVYMHTLAFLVHVNSLLFAIITGISVGTTVHGLRQYVARHWNIEEMSTTIALKTTPLTALLQSLLVEVIKGFAAPLLFQAFLQIGLSIVSPLDEDDAAIPVGKLIHMLEKDLRDARFVAARPPHWDIPRFKDILPPPLPAAAGEKRSQS